jgi:hypothetical protein
MEIKRVIIDDEVPVASRVRGVEYFKQPMFTECSKPQPVPQKTSIPDTTPTNVPQRVLKRKAWPKKNE